MRILFCCKIEDPEARKRLMNVVDLDEIPTQESAQIIKMAPAYDGIIVPYTSHQLVTKEVLTAGVNLKLVGTTYGGVRQNVDDQTALEMDLTLIHTGPTRARPMAEYTLGLILASLTRIHHYHHDMVSGVHWPREVYGRTRVLHNRSVAIVGYGLIGQAIARLLRHFTPSISVVSNHLTSDEAVAEKLSLCSLADAFALHEIIVLAAGYNISTEKLIGRQHFELMQDDALFVNIARGAIVDQQAMIEVARQRHLHLALDVFDPEPLPADSLLRSADRVLLVPHRANAPIEFEQRWAFLADEIERFVAGECPVTALTPERAASMSAS